MTWLVALLLVSICLLLLLGIGLMRVAKHADEAEIEALRALLLEAMLNKLAEMESPSGRHFFETPEARHELEEALADIVPLDMPSEFSEEELAAYRPPRRRRWARAASHRFSRQRTRHVSNAHR